MKGKASLSLSTSIISISSSIGLMVCRLPGRHKDEHVGRLDAMRRKGTMVCFRYQDNLLRTIGDEVGVPEITGLPTNGQLQQDEGTGWRRVARRRGIPRHPQILPWQRQ